LQRADKVPIQRCAFRLRGEMLNFIHAFLHVILAKGTLAGRDGFCDRRHRFGFADCKQSDFFWSACATLSGCRDAASDILQILLDSAHY